MRIKTAGALFFLAGSLIIMGILTAEIFYPGYSITTNMISTLGSTPPPDSIIREPSARIFDFTILFAGILILIGNYLLKPRKILYISLATMGIGVAGVGIFPAYHQYAHPISALLAFSGGGISAILSAKETRNPFRLISVLFGGISLLFLFTGIFFTHLIVPILGAGGTERWAAYPAILWLVGFGGYLMNGKNN